MQGVPREQTDEYFRLLVMSSSHTTNIDLEDFKQWLISQNVEILNISNPNQMLRFKGLHTGVIYQDITKNGIYESNAIRSFKKGYNKNKMGRIRL